MENVGEIIALLVFGGSLVALFVKAGEYKNALNAKIAEHDKEIADIHKDIKDIQISVDKNETNMARFETMLIEIKTKLELILQYSGMFNGIENHKK